MAIDSKPTNTCFKCQPDNPPTNKYCSAYGAAPDATHGAIDAYLDTELRKRLEKVAKGQFGSQEAAELTISANVAEKLMCWAKLVCRRQGRYLEFALD